MPIFNLIIIIIIFMAVIIATIATTTIFTMTIIINHRIIVKLQKWESTPADVMSLHKFSFFCWMITHCFCTLIFLQLPQDALILTMTLSSSLLYLTRSTLRPPVVENPIFRISKRSRRSVLRPSLESGSSWIHSELGMWFAGGQGLHHVSFHSNPLCPAQVCNTEWQQV